MWRRSFAIFVLLILIFPQLLFQVFHKFVFKDVICDVSEPLDEISTNTSDTCALIRVKNQNEIVDMGLEEYITGVVLGEMPADFELEALKSQAVAARTFALRKVQTNGKHQDADVCTDHSCCQAFVFPTDYTGTVDDLNKVRNAVMETSGQVITYNGNLIEAVYFSNSGGQTEDALAVWGTDVPYLQSVDSPGEEYAKNFEVTTTISYAEFIDILELPDDTCYENDDIKVTYTMGGGVNTFSLGSKSISGVRMRTLFNLRSTMFDVEIDGKIVRITTKGYGHRVGMSQYGAEAMAVDGRKYDEILGHYYLGTELITLTGEEMNAIFDKTEII